MTTYEIVKVSPQQASRYGGWYRHVFLKADDGSSAKTCITDACRNLRQWEGVLRVGIKITNLRQKSPGLIDADSLPRIVDEEAAEEVHHAQEDY